ncbi:TRAP transporter small permease [Marinobacterium aestuariivivens]|uniref:TRAP transporter small permease protein n=1 Tax=Marinobacterium aestuariivivens TaxID=1698799 RepID=A0ABW2A223_9GAMM
MSINDWIRARYAEWGPARWPAFALELLAGVTLFALMAMTCVDVVGRYFFNHPLDGGTELTEVGLAILVFAEMPLITCRGGHVVVDILDRRLGHRLVKVLGLLATLLISTAFYFLAVRIFELGERSLRRNEVSEMLQLPLGLVAQYIAVMSWVTAAAMISYGAYRLIRRH